MGNTTPDPISRLEFAVREVDRVFGANYAREHPEVIVATMQTAASDWAAARIALAIEAVAAALFDPDTVPAGDSGIARPPSILRPR